MMARQVTKQLAIVILDKLHATLVKSGKAHDEYRVEHGGRVIAMTSLRRGSEKDLGHDHMPRDLHISPNQAKKLGQCPWKHEDFIRCLQDKGIIPPDPPHAPEGQR